MKKNKHIAQGIELLYLSHVQELEEGVLPVRPRFPEINLPNIIRNLLAVPCYSLAVAFHRQLRGGGRSAHSMFLKSYFARGQEKNNFNYSHERKGWRVGCVCVSCLMIVKHHVGIWHKLIAPHAT